ncbi:hypothetical protein [Sporisorium scitamineum]|uniref:Uncharacterized protein n=1 Tax=Sporisorium scitamineum TaxID=49012 RepID=A0A0F7S803_9BASI|nr:hypothetical protein [Sporisorium scitamineum]
MNPSGHFDAGAQQQQQYPYQQHSSPAGPSGTFRNSDANTTTATAAGGSHLLPHQSFSSPTNSEYPASTLAAVEATRARFFAQQSAGSSRAAPRSAPRSRPTLTGSTLLPRAASTSDTRHRTHKPHLLSSSSSTSYRQSFFDRCQRAMDKSRTLQRHQRITAFRKGADAFTPGGILSDDMDIEDEEPPASSLPPPPPRSSQEREEDDELTRHRIIAEYSRLKRIYELKGHLEIGWIDPDQLSWLEREMKQQQQKEAEVVDPYWLADDEELEQLWVESLQLAG